MRKESNRRYDYNKENYFTPTFSFEENGVIKTNTYFIVPDHLVSVLIGKEGENSREIMSKTGTEIIYGKEVNNILIIFYSLMTILNLILLME